MFWAECKQLWGEGVKGYFSQMWNYMDITMLSLYTAAYAIEAVIYTKVTLVYTRLPQSKGDISMGGCVRLLVFLTCCLPPRLRWHQCVCVCVCVCVLSLIHI